MTLRKKIDRELVINKGASVRDDAIDEDKWTAMTIRLPQSIKNQLKLSLKKRFGLSINSWIIESICEKLQKESNK